MVGGGVVATREEFQHMLRVHAKLSTTELTDEHLACIFHAVDEDLSGKVDFEEFKHWVTRHLADEHSHELSDDDIRARARVRSGGVCWLLLVLVLVLVVAGPCAGGASKSVLPTIIGPSSSVVDVVVMCVFVQVAMLGGSGV